MATIGICSNIVYETMPKQFCDGMSITDGIDELPKFIEEVRNQGADLVILMSHNGFSKDVKILSEVSGVDLA